MAKTKTTRQILSTHLSRALAYEAVGKLTEARQAGGELLAAMLRSGLIDPDLLSQFGTLRGGRKDGTPKS